MIRRTAPLLAAVLLAVLVLGPALAPGYVLQYDMVFVPRQWLLPASFGLGGQLPRAVPQDAVLGALTAVLPGSVWQHLALLAVVVVGALGAARLLRGQPVLARVAAALLLVWSPYVAQRLLLGSWSLLLAVALLPWALQAAVDVRAARPGAGPRLLLLVGLSSITPTGGLLALAVAGPVALRPRSRPTARNRVLLGLGLLALQLPWVVPPPWASSRSKLAQMFYKHQLVPPADIIETSSFLVTLSSMQQRPAIGFLARSVAEHFERQGLLCILNLKLPIELPHVGIITLRGRAKTPASQLLVDSLRETANALS